MKPPKTSNDTFKILAHYLSQITKKTSIVLVRLRKIPAVSNLLNIPSAYAQADEIF